MTQEDAMSTTLSRVRRFGLAGLTAGALFAASLGGALAAPAGMNGKDLTPQQVRAIQIEQLQQAHAQQGAHVQIAHQDQVAQLQAVQAAQQSQLQSAEAAVATQIHDFRQFVAHQLDGD